MRLEGHQSRFPRYLAFETHRSWRRKSAVRDALEIGRHATNVR